MPLIPIPDPTHPPGRRVAPGVWYSDSLRTRNGATVRVLTVAPDIVRLGAAFRDGQRALSAAELKQAPQFLAAINGTFFGAAVIGDMRGLGRTYRDEAVPGVGRSSDAASDGRYFVATTREGKVLTGRGGLAETRRDGEIDAFMGGLGVLFTREQRPNLEADIRSGVFARRIIFRRENQTPAISRSFLGVNGDGQIMLVTMGEGRDRPHGANFVEAARLMRTLGAEEAYILDGGGSTSMIVRGVAETHTDGRPLKGFLGVYARSGQVAGTIR